MGVVAHIHNLHLTYLVDGETIVAVVENRGYIKYIVEVRIERILPSHERHKPRRVVENGPCVLKRVALREITAPFVRIQRKVETAVGTASAHERSIGKIEITVVQRPFLIYPDLIVRLSQCLSKRPDTPVVIGIFQGSRGTLVDSDVTRDISEAVVFLPTHAPGRTDFRMNGVRTVFQGFP